MGTWVFAHLTGNRARPAGAALHHHGAGCGLPVRDEPGLARRR